MKLITLILSAVLLCPMWAGAQTVPSGSSTQTTVGALGTLSFNLKMPLDTTILVASKGAFLFANSIQRLQITPYLPNNNSTSKLLSGVAYLSDSLNSTNPYPMPVMGAISYQDNSHYDLQINIGTTAIACSISSATFNGTCFNSNGVPASITYFSVP